MKQLKQSLIPPCSPSKEKSNVYYDNTSLNLSNIKVDVQF